MNLPHNIFGHTELPSTNKVASKPDIAVQTNFMNKLQGKLPTVQQTSPSTIPSTKKMPLYADDNSEVIPQRRPNQQPPPPTTSKNQPPPPPTKTTSQPQKPATAADSATKPIYSLPTKPQTSIEQPMTKVVGTQKKASQTAAATAVAQKENLLSHTAKKNLAVKRKEATVRDEDDDDDDDDDDEEESVEEKKKTTDYDNAQVSGEYEESTEEEDEEEGSDESDEDEEETDSEINRVVDDALSIAVRAKETARTARPTSFVGADGSASAGDEEEDEDEDEMQEDGKTKKKAAANKKKSVAVGKETWAEHLISAKGMANIVEQMKKINPEIQKFPENDIWVLNKLLAAMLAPRFPMLVATAIGLTNSNDSEMLARVEKLATYNPHETKVASIKKMPNQFCKIIALADEFGLIRSLVSSAVDSNTVISSMRLDPFKEEELKMFGAVCADMGFFPKKHQFAPITQDRYALMKGNTDLTPLVVPKPVSEKTSSAPETAKHPLPPQQQQLDKQPYIAKKYVDSRHVMIAPYRSLLAYNHETNMALAQIKWTIAPNKVLSSLFEYQADVRANTVVLPLAETRRESHRFIHYIYLSATSNEIVDGNAIAAYLADTKTPKIIDDETFAYAHLLFSFLVPNRDYAIQDSMSQPFSFNRCLIETFDKSMQGFVKHNLTLEVNELPIIYSFVMRSKTRLLLEALWAEYCVAIKLAPNDSASTYRSQREVRAAAKDIVKKSFNYITSGDWETSTDEHLTGPLAVQDMLISTVEALFVI